MNLLCKVGWACFLICSILVVEGLAENRVLVIPKGSHASFWQNLGRGAKQAGDELGLSVVVRSPKYENSHAAQAGIIRSGIKGGYDAIVLAPTHESMNSEILAEAVQNNMEIVLVDSGMASSHHSSLVASDNGMAGRLAAEYMNMLLNGRGKVVLARHLEGHVSTQMREQTFIDTLAERSSEIDIIADPYVGMSKGEAYHIISAILETSSVDGIFCDSEEATLGILRAIKKNELKDRPRFIGFDFNRTIDQAIRDGDMDAAIVQNPYLMGYRGIEIVDRLLNNEEVPEEVYTVLTLVNKDNYNSNEVQQVIGQYLSLQPEDAAE